MKSFSLLFLLTFLLVIPLEAQIMPHRLISDGMVLQRGITVPVFGGGGLAGHALEVDFRGEVYRTVVGNDGSWEVMLPEQQPGGPFEMVIRQPGDTLTLKQIYLGDVWVASGQSNMDMAMRMAWPLYEQVTVTAEYPGVRHFTVPKEAEFGQPRKDLPGGRWVSVSPENNPGLSAVAFFFSTHIHRTQQIPVGIINASLGGSPAEAWMSEQALANWPHHYEEAVQFRNAALIDSVEHSESLRISEWYGQLIREDSGYRGTLPWHHPDVDHSGWPVMNVPGTWAEAIAGGALPGTESEGGREPVQGRSVASETDDLPELVPLNGVVWVRRDLYLEEAPVPGEPVLLTLGTIVDADSVFVNGRYAGNTRYRHPPRWYTVQEGLLRKGRNTITVRIVNERGLGGFLRDKPYELLIGRGGNARRYDLEGPWHFRIGAEAEPLAQRIVIRRKPLGLFNAMIAPLLRYPVTGVIWYQGESNASRAEEYRTLFPDLIHDWRRQWDQGDFPFLFVQLANYMEATDNPSASSNWAMLREAQFTTMQAVPNTAMAVTIDIGEWNDIHPLNKKDVGDRLALAARRLAYGEQVAATGPFFRGAQVEGNRIILEFDGIYGGLRAGRPDSDTVREPRMTAGERAPEVPLGGFAVAGTDGWYFWAAAEIEGDRVVIWSDEVHSPVSVRYAWANNPVDANLYNAAGLPAVPFWYRVE